MAAPLQIIGSFLRIRGGSTLSLSRSAFVARKNDPHNPNWIKVGLTLGSTVAIWALLIKQRNEDIAEHEKWKAEHGN